MICKGPLLNLQMHRRPLWPLTSLSDAVQLLCNMQHASTFIIPVSLWTNFNEFQGWQRKKNVLDGWSKSHVIFSDALLMFHVLILNPSPSGCALKDWDKIASWFRHETGCRAILVAWEGPMQYYTGDFNVVDDQCKFQMSLAFDISVIFKCLRSHSRRHS